MSITSTGVGWGPVETPCRDWRWQTRLLSRLHIRSWENHEWGAWLPAPHTNNEYYRECHRCPWIELGEKR